MNLAKWLRVSHIFICLLSCDVCNTIGARIFFRDANAPQQAATGVEGAAEVKRAPDANAPAAAATPSVAVADGNAPAPFDVCTSYVMAIAYVIN
jgi:hypothetical protein